VASATRLIVVPAAIAVALVIFGSLALVNVVPGWGVLFFYVLPTLFFGVWSVREFKPSLWRRTGTPLRRALRSTPLAEPLPQVELPPPPARPKRREWRRPEAIRSLGDAFAAAAWLWLELMRMFLSIWRTRRGRILLNVAFGSSALAILFFVFRDLSAHGWPLAHARPAPAAAAAAFFLSTFALRAVGWQRLFRPFERPRSLALVGSTGTAAIAALALPSRIDDAISIGVLRRLAPRAPSVGTLALSLFLLGLLDIATLTPFAIVAAFTSGAGYAVRLSMALIAGMGFGAGVVAITLPMIRRSERLTKFRLGHWLAVHAPASRRDAGWASTLVCASWLSRAGGIFLLLHALGLPASFGLASSYVTAGAAAASLPIGPAGAATQAGVGAAVLAGAGVGTSDAIALAVAAQGLTVAAGATFAGFAGATHLWQRRRASR
jgi:hypothetical protein